MPKKKKRIFSAKLLVILIILILALVFLIQFMPTIPITLKSGLAYITIVK